MCRSDLGKSSLTAQDSDGCVIPICKVGHNGSPVSTGHCEDWPGREWGFYKSQLFFPVERAGLREEEDLETAHPTNFTYWLKLFLSVKMSIFLFNFWLHHAAYEISILQPGIEPMPPVVEAQSLNYWTTGTFHRRVFLTIFKKSELLFHSIIPQACLVAQSCLTLCDPIDGSPPGSSVHGILQVRILEWVTISSSRGCSQSRDRTPVSYVSYSGRQILYHCTTWEALKVYLICELTSHRRKAESDL